MRVVIEPIQLHQDARGAVFEPLDPESISTQRNVHVVLTQPGCVRGNHYHKLGTETLTVFGPALVRFRDGSAIEDTVIAEGQVVRFTIPPSVAHAVKNTGSQPIVIIAFNTVAHDRQQPDVFRDILIES